MSSAVNPKERPVSRVVSVSGPLELDGFNTTAASSPLSSQGEWADSVEVDGEALEAQFDQLIKDLGIKGASRSAMLALPDDRKRFLVAQNEAAKSTPSKVKVASAQGSDPAAGSDTSGMFADTLSRASTALNWGNRFSIASLAGWSGEESATSSSSPPTSSSARESYPSSSKTTSGTADSSEAGEGVKANVTGASMSLWTSWWGNASEAVEKDDPAYYPRLLSSSKLSRKEMVKTLISLRVTLSSAKLVWISAFLDEKGLEALEGLLQVETLPFANGNLVELKEMSDVVLSESVKCLRTLMNTEPGFNNVLLQPHLINCIAYSLKAPSYKLRSQVADLLAALCVLSLSDGHRLVCAALSELRIAAGQRYRFGFLVDSLSLEHGSEDYASVADEMEEAALWDYRTSALVLINALANCPEDLEERVGLREEFTRRGLNEAMVALGYVDPPDGVLTQLQVYGEERQDDLDELHERALAAHPASSSLDADTTAERTLEALGERDAELANLRSDVAKLQEEMIRAIQAQSSSEEGLRASHAMEMSSQQERVIALQREVDVLQTLVQQLQAQAQAAGQGKAKATDETSPTSSPPGPISAVSEDAPPPPPPPPPAPLMAPSSPAPKAMSAGAFSMVPPPPPLPPPPPARMTTMGAVPLPPPPPPMPGSGPPPPPPPPFAGLASHGPPLPALMQMPKIAEKRRKPLFWSKLPAHAVVKTVWNDLPPGNVDVRLDDLDAIFSIKNQLKDDKKAGKGEERKNAPTTLIDLQRAQNIAIMLSRIKMSFGQIRLTLLEVESEELTLDKLKVIRNCLPTSEEAELVREHQGDFALLSKADQFFKEVVGIPKLKSRVDCMVYMKRFETDLEELKPDLKILREAVNEVNGSTKFRLILKNVLMLGNILNNKTFRGEARGFMLSDLLKLRETRAAGAGPGHGAIVVTPTLLHYLVQVLNRENESLVGFLDDCEHVEAAARVSTASVTAGVSTMMSGMDMIREEVKVLKRAGISSSNDRFLPLSQAFLQQASGQMEMLKRTSEEINRDLARMLEYYGESEKTTRAEEFFSLISSFGQSLMRAEVEVKENEARLAKDKEGKKAAGVVKAAPLVVTTTMLASLRKSEEGTEEEEEEEEEGVKTPLALTRSNSGKVGSMRGSRFRSWGQSAVESLTVTASRDQADGSEGRQSTLGKSVVARGQLDEAIKELRMGGGKNGRKSLRRQGGHEAHRRPLSRVFLDN